MDTMDQPLSLLIADIPLFDALDHDEISTLETMLQLRDIKPGAVVYAQGEHADSMCCVLEGELEVIKQLKDGNEHRLTTLTKGDSLGEMALIDGLTRSASVRASLPSRVLILKRDDFNKLIKEQPHISIKILKQIARRLSMNLRKTSEAMSRAGR